MGAGITVRKERMKKILVLSHDADACRTLQSVFSPEFRLDMLGDLEQAMALFAGNRYEYSFLDLQLLAGDEPLQRSTDTRPLFQRLWNIYPTAILFILTDHNGVRNAVEAVKTGVSNYLTYPLVPDEVQYVVASVNESLRMELELDVLRQNILQEDIKQFITTGNPSFQAVINSIQKVADTEALVMLYGESGTGKGIMARLIHALSGRRQGPFISVHCGAIPDTLLESELFGHERGAFTGATKRKMGRFEIASNGSIFLDEIGTMPALAQVKLLRVLQDGAFTRVGGETEVHTNARVLVATNSNLKEMSENGQFRSDLFYRMNVFPIALPPLRERKEDIPQIADNVLRRLNRKYKKEIHVIHAYVLDAFMAYNWPGNIRELENLVERAYILENSDVLTPRSFSQELFHSGGMMQAVGVSANQTLAEVRKRGVSQIEEMYLRDVLVRTRGRVSAAAGLAGMTVRNFTYLMQKYNLHKESFRHD